MDSIGLLELVALGINLNHYKKIGFDSNGKYIVDIFEDIDLRGKDLTNINRIKLREVTGNFNCSGCHLISLGFAPESVKGKFDCSNNELTSLEGCPKEVGGAFDCSKNQLTSLEYCPETINATFYCSDNPLKTLKGCPQTVKGNFYCYDCQLVSLEYAPKYVGRDFECSYNPISDISNIPTERIGGKFEGRYTQIKNTTVLNGIVKEEIIIEK